MSFSVCVFDFWSLGESPQDDVCLGFVSRPGGVQPLCCLEAAGHLSLEHRAGPLSCLRTHTHTWFRMEGSGCAHTLHCVTLSLKHDCTTWAVSYHWTWEWCNMVGWTCDSQLIVLHLCCRFVFSSSLHSRVSGKAVPFISNNDLKGIVQPDMVTQLSVSGKAQKPM